jgi:hypothetical protein
MPRYKVRPTQDDYYKVVRILTESEAREKGSIDHLEKSWDGEGYEEIVLYDSRLADCEAWIRLHEGGYM